MEFHAPCQTVYLAVDRHPGLSGGSHWSMLVVWRTCRYFMVDQAEFYRRSRKKTKKAKKRTGRDSRRRQPASAVSAVDVSVSVSSRTKKGRRVKQGKPDSKSSSKDSLEETKYPGASAPRSADHLKAPRAGLQPKGILKDIGAGSDSGKSVSWSDQQQQEEEEDQAQAQAIGSRRRNNRAKTKSKKKKKGTDRVKLEDDDEERLERQERRKAQLRRESITHGNS